MTTRRLGALDAMKALGMALIVLGHVGGAWINHLTPPFYPKQLGVAFFLFAAGFLLARERRAWPEVLYRRLFEVALLGIGFAALMSAITYTRAGTLALSNYLPFALGANVAFDNFPANPTTWFIGTYIHALVVWALVLRHVRVRPWMFALVVPAEIAIRAALMREAGLFRAYMLLPNWATVLLMGLYFGQDDREPCPGRSGLLVGGAVLAVLLLVWPRAAWATLEPVRSFPFMRLLTPPGHSNLVLTSAAVTGLYASFTWATYQVVGWIPATAVARFLARNTAFVFIAHMPVFYAIGGPIRAQLGGGIASVLVLFAICDVGLAAASEAIRRLIRPDELRDHIWIRMLRSRHAQHPGTEHARVPHTVALDAPPKPPEHALG